jgi:hypothetical protein
MDYALYEGISAQNGQVPIPHSCRNIMTTSDMPSSGVNVM